MDTLHCRQHHGFILLLVLFHSFLIGLASKIDVSYDSRGIRTDGGQKRFLTNSPQHGKEKTTCTNTKPDPGPLAVISCFEPGHVITKIKFADYGNPTGTCGHFRHGNCGAPATLRLVKKNCLGKEQCWFPVTDEMFGPTHCKGPVKIAILGTCTKKKVA